MCDIDKQLKFMYLSDNNCFSPLVSILIKLVDLNVPIHSGAHQSLLHPPHQLMQERTLTWQDFKHVRASFGQGDLCSVQAMGAYNTLNHQYRTHAIWSWVLLEEHLLDQLCAGPNLFHSYISNKRLINLSGLFMLLVVSILVVPRS